MELVLRPSTDANAVVAELSPVLISSDRLGVEWSVPAQFMQLSVEQIIQSVLHAGAPTPNETEHASYISSDSPLLSSAVDSGIDALLEGDFPHTSLEGQTLHDYHALVTLGSVCTIIKYWVYMKLLWRHRGGNDNIVIAVMARCENMHEPHPLTNRKNSRQWTLVRNGLRIMEILLNNRGLLFQLLVTRRLSFNNLICLKQDWLQQPVIQQLVAVVQRDEQLALPAGPAARKQNALSVAAMTALCEAGAAIGASPAKSSSSSSTSSSPSRLGTASKPVPTLRKARETTNRNGSDGKRKRRKRDAVVEDATRDPDRQGSVDERSGEPSTIEMSNSAAPVGVAADIGSADMLLQLNHALSSLPLLEQHSEVQSEMNAPPSTTAPLDYYFDLVQRYPDRVEVAASVEFASSGLSAMMEHRLQDRCTASIIVFDHSFLLHRSDRLRFLPAMRVAGGVSALLDVARGPKKVWVLFPSYEGQECDNEDAAMDVLDRHYGSRSAWTTTRDNPIIAPPLSMFLDAGMHVMLVIQREGEMVLLPSGKSPSRPGVQLVHSLSSSGGSSAFGMYQPIRHVVACLTERFRTSGVAEHDAAEGDFEEYECGPFGEVFVEHAPLYVRPRRPTLEFLQRVGHTPTSSEAANARSHAAGAELNSSEQNIFLLNMALRDLIERRVSPHPALFNELTELHRSAHTRHQRAGLLVALTQLMALYTTTLNARPHEGCSPHFGCGSDPFTVSDVAKQNDASIFRHSSRLCLGPVLFFRFDESATTTLSQYEAQMVEEHTTACLTTINSVARSTEGASANISSPNHSDEGSQLSSRASRVQALLRSVLHDDLIDGLVMRWWRFPLPSDIREQHLNGTRSLPAQLHLQTQPYQLGCWDFAIPHNRSCAEQEQDTTSSGPTADCATQDAVQAVYNVLHEMDADDQHAHTAQHRDACSQRWLQRDMEAIIRSIESHPVRSDDRLMVVAQHNSAAALHASCALGFPAVGLDSDAERCELAKDIQRRWRSRRGASDTLHPEVSFLNDDLMNQLPLLFSVSHLLIEQASMSPSAVRLMEEVLCHMTDSKLRWVYLVRRRSSTDECQQNSADHDNNRPWSTMSPVHAVHSESIQVQVYNVFSPGTHQSQSLVQVFRRPSGDLGLRAAQRLQAHQAVLAVVGEVINDKTFDQLSSKSGSTTGTSLLQWKGRWMRVENIAQFAQGHEDKTRINLEYTTDQYGQLQYSTVVDVEQGNELFVCCLHGDDGGGPVHQARDVSTLHCLDVSLATYLH